MMLILPYDNAEISCNFFYRLLVKYLAIFLS